jgi:hypothetical protein
MREQIELPIKNTQLSFEHLAAPEMAIYKGKITPREMFPNFKKGYSAFGMNNGSFSFGDIIEYVLSKTGPAHALISTWVASQAATTKVCQFLNDNRFLSVRFLVDRMFSESRKPVYDYIVENFGLDAIRTSRCHTKFCVLYNDDWSVVIETSANLNKNLRLEGFRITESEDFCGFFRDMFDDFFNVIAPSDNTKLSSAQKIEALTEKSYSHEPEEEESNAFELEYDFG